VQCFNAVRAEVDGAVLRQERPRVEGHALLALVRLAVARVAQCRVQLLTVRPLFEAMSTHLQLFERLCVQSLSGK
jgi:hypothetical protein